MRFIHLPAVEAMNLLAKWRAAFASWQVGTRPKDDPELRAIKDHREATICLRVEVNTLTKLLLDKGIFTSEEYSNVLKAECEALNAMYEQRFPGFTVNENGLSIDLANGGAETMKGFPP